MFNLLPNTDAPLANWLSHHAGPLTFAVIVIAACVWKALLHGTNNDGWSDSGPGSHHCDSAGGDSCGD
jgi:hypothetical protein